MIECKTVRWERHSAFSAGRYENVEDAQKWKTVDPIPRLRQMLLTDGASSEQIDFEDTAARSAVQEAVEFAIQSPMPGPESITEGVFAVERHTGSLPEKPTM